MKNTKSFTIVELLIVIVVIAILATITIVIYNAIQDRATYTARLSDLTNLKKTIEAYNANTGNYPLVVSGRYSCNYSSSIEFIPGIETITESLPTAPYKSGVSNDTWWYASDSSGTNYKIIYLRASISDRVRAMIPASMQDPIRWSGGTSSWGYWTPGGASL